MRGAGESAKSEVEFHRSHQVPLPKPKLRKKRGEVDHARARVR